METVQEDIQNNVSTTTTTTSPTTTTPTPTLAQIGKQTSLNFRHSQLYDSGAESCDNDEQIRLIRTPSIRSHKFIIIPAASNTDGNTIESGGGSSSSTTTVSVLPFRQTISASSLNALSAAIQKQPFNYTKKQRPLSTTSTSSSCKLLSQPSFNLNDVYLDELRQQQQQNLQIKTSQTDVIHQPLSTTTATATSAVRFTLSDDDDMNAILDANLTTQETTISTTEIVMDTATSMNSINSTTTTTKPQKELQTSSSITTNTTLKPPNFHRISKNDSMKSILSGKFIKNKISLS